MRDIGRQLRRLAACGAAAAFATLPAAAAPAPLPEPDPAEQRLNDGFSIQAFRAPYEQLIKGVEPGCSDRSPQHRATALWYSLREELLALNARIEGFKLEAKQFEGPRQERALQGLARAAAERERVLARHVVALGELAPATRAGGAAPARKAADRITIEFVPEDVVGSGRN